MYLSISRLIFPIVVLTLLSASNVVFSETHHAGATLGALSVDAGGSANYSVELQVPPGTAGMQPSLSLNYSSGGGNGIMGMGWSLGAYSTIARCNAKLELDGYNQGAAFNERDRFCLNGQRLVAVNGAYGADGTEYRTQKNTYTKIISYGQAGSGPAYFKVWTKSGQVSIYGEDNRTFCSAQGIEGDSRIEAQGKKDVLVWAVGKIEDTVGNYMRFCYHEDMFTGEHRLGRIDYTGNENKGLEPYAHVAFNYEKRDDKSARFVKGSIIASEYRLSEIKSSSNGQTAKTYKLNYRYSTGKIKSSLLTGLTECGSEGVCKLSSSFEWKDSIVSQRFSDWVNWSTTAVGGTCTTGDLNQDGLDDLVCGYRKYISNGESFEVSADYPAGVYQVLADVNGDKYKDIVYSSSDLDDYKSKFIRYGSANGFDSELSYNAGRATAAGDRDGDGKDEIYSMYFGREPVFDQGIVVDVDGDGLADIVEKDEDTSQGWVKKSTVNGFAWQENWGGAGNYYSSGDVDGDGFPELLSRNQGMFSSTGQSIVVAPITYENPSQTYNFNFFGDEERSVTYLADVNGDGLSDMVVANGGMHVALSKPAEPDLMVIVTDGLGDKIAIEYSQTDDAEVYSQVSQQDQIAYPLSPLRNKMILVKKYSIANGLGGEYSFTYHYEDGIVHRNTYGFLGFKKVTLTDSRSGIQNITNYSHDYDNQLHGLAIASETRLADNTLVEESSVSWTSVALPVSSYDKQRRFIIHKLGSDESSYQLDGQLISTISTAYDYDDYGNATSVTVSSNDGYKKVTNSVYLNNTDLWHLGRLQSTIITNTTPFNETGSRKSSFEYDPQTGLLTKETVEPGNVTHSKTTTYTYDAYGNKTNITITAPDAAARSTTMAFDERGQFPTKTTNALNHSETYQYDLRWGVKTRLTGPNGLVTQWSYDSLGRQIKELRADGTWTTTSFDLCEDGPQCPYGSPLWVTKLASGGVPSTVYFDSLGREVRSTTEGMDGRVIEKLTEYNADGRVSQVSQLHFVSDSYGWSRYEYDILGRMVKETNPDESFTTITYDGFKITRTNDKGQSNTEIKNSQGKIIQVIDAMGGISVYDYDAFDNLISTIDNENNQTRMHYDVVGNKTSMDDLDMGHWEYRHNALGELIWQKDALGQEISMSYDPLGRMIKRVEKEGTSTWAYDTATNGIGKLDKSSSASNVSESHSYDAYGRPQQTRTIIDGKTFDSKVSYDSLGRVLTKTYPSGYAIKNIYNDKGFLIEVRTADAGNKLYWALETTDASGHPLQQRFGNNVTTLQQYDEQTGRLTGIMTGNSGNVQHLSYDYDTLGNMISRSDLNQSINETFGFDDLNRLTNSTVGSQVNSLTYDSIGNITFKTGVGNYQYTGASPHAVSQAGNIQYGYDANGNMTSGDGRTLSYTSFNKPLTVSRGSTANTYTYGIDHNRIKKSSIKSGQTTTTYYIGKTFEKNYQSNGVNVDKHYIGVGSATVVYTSRSNGAKETRYQHKDHLGSTDVMTDESGAIVPNSRSSFDAWGARRNSNWTDTGNFGINMISLDTRGFTGHEHDDEIGLINMNARMYDAKLGRFLSPDTFVQFPYSTQGMNRYTYVNNNPISYTDPSGHFIKGLLRGALRFFQKYGRLIMTVVFAYITGGIVGGFPIFGESAIFQGAAGGFGGGFAGTGTLDGALNGALSGALFAGVGDIFGHSSADLSSGAFAGKVIAHGIVGGGMAKLQGGAFKNGFFSAAFTQSLSRSSLFKGGTKLSRVFKSAIVGGVASKFGGGKFANGAVTGSFSRLFNDEAVKESKGLKIGAEIKNRLLNLYGDSEGKLKFSKDLKAVSLTVNESGDVIVSAQGGVFKGAYELGEGLHSLGLKVPGAELKFSNFTQDSLKWSVSVPKSIFGITFKGSYSGSINYNPINAGRHNGILAPSFDRIHNPDLRCGGCGL